MRKNFLLCKTVWIGETLWNQRVMNLNRVGTGLAIFISHGVAEPSEGISEHPRRWISRPDAEATEISEN
jgi:hypothetical protein